MSQFTFYLIYCGRNDNYSDQDDRIPRFIDYYTSLHSSEYNIEIVLIDWNTPKSNCSLLEAFDWNKFEKVHSLVVTEQEHESIDKNKKRPIVDYAGRNRGLNFVKQLEGSGIAVIVNQDIFIKQEVFDVLWSEGKNDRYFYRADRTDIVWLNDDPNRLEYQVVNTFSRLFEWPMNYLVNKRRAIRFFEYVDSNFIIQKYLHHSSFYTILKIFFEFTYLPRRSRFFPCVLFGLHGNGSGDFLAIPKNVLEKLDEKYPETTDFYMHTDSYILYRLLKKDIRQKIFRAKEVVLHVDHKRKHVTETWSYEDHLAKFQEIMCE